MLRRLLYISLFFIVLAALCTPVGRSSASPGDIKLDVGKKNLAKDSVFLNTYSQKLGVPLDTTCDAALVLTVADWIGTPYRHAGYSKAGVDCSGFVSKIYSDVYGVALTHSSYAMIHQMKELVKKSELRQGDVLFFKIHGGRISHVGLYLGNYKFIHASPERGIVIDDLREAYYQRTYYTAGRVLCK